ncbi:outer membrane protein assembly factor BamB family protein [Sphaerisporangium aureirubrum]|uniref:PQQ-binding-like beta-propeller repeat protein n=1 Tax=Sphaerisporangium aureirubrum TaxID=1544736 RepID=A0ABW1NNJ9_9ACTN
MTTGGSGWQLAIDFGTCYTSAATLYAGDVEPLELEPGEARYFPSVVVVTGGEDGLNGEEGEDGDGFVVGTEALNRAGLDPARVVRLPKRELRASAHTLVDDRLIETADLVAAIFRKVLAVALRKFAFTGQGPERVVLTHPARWSGEPLDRLTQAAARAGLGAVDFVPEPVAAARWYLRMRELSVGEYVVVYDLGGGTFDTAVLRRTDDGFEVRGQPGGREDIGGEDFDQALLEIVQAEARRRDPRAAYAVWEGTDWKARMWQSQWAKDVTVAKKSLSERERWLIRGEGFYEPGILVTRGQFEEAISGMVLKTVRELGAAIRQVAPTGAGVDTVYLTGGSSAIPLIRRMIREDSGGRLDAVVAPEPKAAVALGALTEPPPPEGAPPRLRLWRREVVGRPTAPVLSGQTLYVGTGDGFIYAFEAATGERVWYRAVCAAVTPPVVHGDRLYIGDADGRLSALAAEDGVRQWYRFLGPATPRRQRRITASPVVHGDRVFVGCEERGLYCYGVDGERLWTYGIAGVDGCPPVAVRDLVFAGSQSGRVTAVTAATGERRMKRRLPAPIAAPLAVTAHIVFAAAEDGVVYAVDRAGDNPVLWSRPVGVPRGTGPVFDRGRVYVGTADGRLLGLDAESGAERVSLPVGGPVTATPVVRDGTAYVVAGDSLTALDLTAGETRWTRDAGGAVAGPPAIGSAFAYIAVSTGHIETVDLATGAWPR